MPHPDRKTESWGGHHADRSQIAARRLHAHRRSLGGFALPAPAVAQSADYFAGKTLRVIVGLEAGGTADVFIRGFSAQLRKHIPGNPTVVVQNMTGAGGSVAANYTYERAAPDGLTIVFNTFHPLAQALGGTEGCTAMPRK